MNTFASSLIEQSKQEFICLASLIRVILKKTSVSECDEKHLANKQMNYAAGFSEN